MSDPDPDPVCSLPPLQFYEGCSYAHVLQVFSQDVLMKFVPRYSLVVELRDGGLCTRSFHDPSGLVVAYISEVHEHDGSLYLGSFRSPYVAKLDLHKV